MSLECHRHPVRSGPALRRFVCVASSSVSGAGSTHCALLYSQPPHSVLFCSVQQSHAVRVRTVTTAQCKVDSLIRGSAKCDGQTACVGVGAGGEKRRRGEAIGGERTGEEEFSSSEQRATSVCRCTAQSSAQVMPAGTDATRRDATSSNEETDARGREDGRAKENT